MKVRQEIFSGIKWISLLRLSQRLVGYLKVAILARLLTPHQFGIFAIATLVLALLEVFTETGVNVFLIQTKESLQKYLNTAWVISIIRGFLIGFILYISSPFIASFFNSSETQRLLMLISLVPILRGFINPSIIRFRKNLEFNKEFTFYLVTFFVESALAVILTAILRTADALILAIIFGVFFEVIISHLFVRPNPTIAFDLNQAKEITKVGKWITAAGIVHYLIKQGDDMVVGRLLSANALGLYQNAYKISTLILIEIMEIAGKVAFPIFSKIKDDKEKLKNYFLKLSLVLILIIIPAGLIMYLFPEQLILILLGNQWLEATGVLKVLSIFGIVSAISAIPNSLFLSIERQDILVKINIIQLVAMSLIIIPLVSEYGIIGAAYATTLAVIFSIPVSVYFVRKLFKYS